MVLLCYSIILHLQSGDASLVQLETICHFINYGHPVE